MQLLTHPDKDPHKYSQVMWKCGWVRSYRSM